MSELMTPEEARSRGVSDPFVAIGLTIGEEFRNLYSLQGSNVRSFLQSQGVIICQGVVLKKPIAYLSEFILAEFTAPLLGFYNSEPEVISAAYGKPVFLKGWRVRTGCTNSAYVSGDVLHYGTVVFHPVDDFFAPKEPKTI